MRSAASSSKTTPRGPVRSSAAHNNDTDATDSATSLPRIRQSAPELGGQQQPTLVVQQATQNAAQAYANATGLRMLCMLYLTFDLDLGYMISCSSPDDPQLPVFQPRAFHVQGQAPVATPQQMTATGVLDLHAKVKECGYHFLPDRDCCWRVVCVSLSEGLAMMGVPVYLEDSKYERSSLVFCVAFIVPDTNSDTDETPPWEVYREIAQQLAISFARMELDPSLRLLSDESHRPTVKYILESVREQLNSCTGVGELFYNVSEIPKLLENADDVVHVPVTETHSVTFRHSLTRLANEASLSATVWNAVAASGQTQRGYSALYQPDPHQHDSDSQSASEARNSSESPRRNAPAGDESTPESGLSLAWNSGSSTGPSLSSASWITEPQSEEDNERFRRRDLQHVAASPIEPFQMPFPQLALVSLDDSEDDNDHRMRPPACLGGTDEVDLFASQILHLCNGLRTVWEISEMACAANLSMTTECLENLVAIGAVFMLDPIDAHSHYMVNATELHSHFDDELIRADAVRFVCPDLAETLASMEEECLMSSPLGSRASSLADWLMGSDFEERRSDVPSLPPSRWESAAENIYRLYLEMDQSLPLGEWLKNKWHHFKAASASPRHFVVYGLVMGILRPMRLFPTLSPSELHEVRSQVITIDFPVDPPQVHYRHPVGKLGGRPEPTPQSKAWPVKQAFLTREEQALARQQEILNDTVVLGNAAQLCLLFDMLLVALFNFRRCVMARYLSTISLSNLTSDPREEDNHTE
ncbi:hypothetical protein FOL47_002279 [Perkinsus chesapeaki]|uniref:Nitrogen permease regulator 2 n=1 Tax=Perkinsus chesapeaki TaxID=330153 RepID=A0A7J6MEM8_PERCH|nr:hypothetical protein FOL47_002279 [Perkinsus chesapeaki]